jgi:hypothetical protein
MTHDPRPKTDDRRPTTVNYFNYFTEIEEHFQRLRGTTLLLSTLDWALIETWKDAGIPLEAVLRGIDVAFEKFQKRPLVLRKVNSLAYCSQAVLEAAEQMKEAETGAANAMANPEEKAEAAGMDRSTVTRYLRHNREILHEKAPSFGDAQVGVIIEQASISLADMAGQIESEANSSLEDLERRLTVLEEKINAALLNAASEAELLDVRTQADRDLAPYRRQMSGPQIEQLHRQYVSKRLLEKWGLPRLSLFYM